MRTPFRIARPMKTLAAVLAGVLVALCLGAVAHATMPGSDRADCQGLLCDQEFGCGGPTPAGAFVAEVRSLPTAAVLPAIDTLATPGPGVETPVASGVDDALSRCVAPFAPRSPPLV